MWYLVLFAVILIGKYKTQKKSPKAKEFDEALFALIEDEELKEKARKTLQLSLKNTLKYFIYSSLVYLIVFAFVFLYLYNSH
jgi:uncharacterized ferredoxin-like protein